MRGWCYTTYILFLLDSSWVYFVKWSFCTLQQTLHALLQNKLTLLSLYTLTHQIIAIHTSIFLYFDKPNKYASILHLYILWRFQFTGTAVHLLYGRLAGWTAYMIMMIVSKMMLVMIIIVLKMMMLVMIKGVGECRFCGQKQTPATPLWQFWQARLSVVCSQCWPAALSVWASWILPPPIWALGLSQKRWESSVICVRTHFYLPASWTATWVNNTKSHVS